MPVYGLKFVTRVAQTIYKRC